MISFTVSVPSVVILFGEHAIRYGKTGLITTINIRTTATFNELRKSSKDIIKIEFPQINLFCTILSQTFVDYFNYYDYKLYEDTSVFYKKVQDFITTQNLSRTPDQNRYLNIIFRLVFYIGCKEKIHLRSFGIYLITELTFETNFDIYASIVACLAACYFNWLLLQNNVRSITNYLAKIARYAKACYDDASYTFSKIYIDLCLLGHAKEFRSMDVIHKVRLSDLKILLVDTQVEYNLAKKEAQDKQLAILRDSFPTIFNFILTSIDYISHEVSTLLFNNTENGGNDITSTITTNMEISLEIKRQTRKFKYLISMNHGLLNALGVSNYNADTICSLVRKHGLAAKYINEGRQVFIWLPPSVTSTDILNLKTELETKNFDVIETSVICSGIKVEYITY